MLSKLKGHNVKKKRYSYAIDLYFLDVASTYFVAIPVVL